MTSVYAPLTRATAPRIHAALRALDVSDGPRTVLVSSLHGSGAGVERVACASTVRLSLASAALAFMARPLECGPAQAVSLHPDAPPVVTPYYAPEGPSLAEDFDAREFRVALLDREGEPVPLREWLPTDGERAAASVRERAAALVRGEAAEWVEYPHLAAQLHRLADWIDALPLDPP